MADKIEKIEISKADLIRLVKFIESSNDFFHQPMKYEEKSQVLDFAKTQYPEIHHLYYKVLDKVLSAEIKKELWDI